ncbi:hypothetical protein [Lentzea albida]|uniref:Uncharacterized protein n=1 Tax=Lentzea albida TaxID=65499 RepID=A0A1H9X5Y6_9PSEU|nr:hypothetical protein [Lentzea albida]SES41544.1 hypothetical protein SAMN04488000_12816 [Lentzea albida]
MTGTRKDDGRAPEWLHRLARERTRYEEQLGWPAWIVVGQRCLCMRTPGAVVVEQDVALRVVEAVPACGPALHRFDGNWVFLTSTAHVPEGNVRQGVTMLAWPVVELPDTEHSPRWAVAPAAHRPLPTAADVLAAIDLVRGAAAA